MKHNNSHRAALLFLAAVLMVTAGCAMQHKLQTLANDDANCDLTLPADRNYQVPTVSTKVKKDTIKVVDFDGKDMFLMKTIVDSAGDVAATDVLNAAVVSTRFRNIAERNGKIPIEFQIRVPAVFKEQRWQMRLTPVLFAGADSTKLDQLVVTGDTYREFEELGDKIIYDLENKIEASEGVARRNLEAMRGYYYNRFYMPKPKSVRVDTLIRDDYEELVYEYSYEFQPSPGLRKVDLVMDGDVLAMNDYIYHMPRSKALTFFISSLSTLVDNTEKYKTAVISRRLAANMSYNIEFAQGKWPLDPNFRNNAQVISEIENQLNTLLENKVYDLDSIVVTASASPEGSYSLNRDLSKKRSESISYYFNMYMRNKINELNRGYEEEYSIDAETQNVSVHNEKIKPIPFISRSIPENWDLLGELIMADTELTATDKDQYLQCCNTISNVDSRDWRMKEFKWYKYVSKQHYPKLRAVRFDFNMHRKGMVKDTVHTTILDTTYMEGVQAIRDMDYDRAVELLRPYEDYNTAVAYCAAGRNMSALEILEKEPQTPKTHYLKAVIYARLGDEEKSVNEFVESCKGDRSFINRGNLDPEISSLIRKYNINLLESEEGKAGW